MKTSQQQQFEAAGDAGGGLAFFWLWRSLGEGFAGGDEGVEEFALGSAAAGTGVSRHG